MKRARIIVGLVALGCLAAGSAKFGFGQMNGTQVVAPTPPPLVLPACDESVQPAEQPYQPPPGKIVPAGGPELVVPSPAPLPQTSRALPAGLPAPQTPGSSPSPVYVVPPNVLVPGKGAPASGALQVEVPPAQQAVPEIAEPAVNADNPTGRQEPAVSLEWVGPVTLRLNQPATFQILIKNVSVSPLHNVTVQYRIPAGVRIVGGDPAPANDGSLLTWDLGTLMPAQDKRIDLQIYPEAKVAITCHASVTFTGSASIKLQVREPKLVLKAAAPERVVQGDVATVALTVSNPGDGAADHVKIKAALPEGLEHARGKMFELDLGTLAPNENRTVQLVCLARLPGPQVVDCVAVADAGLNAQDTAKVDVVVPRLDLVVTGPKLRYVDRHATYVLKVTNPGSAPASNVTIFHQLPQGFKFDKASNGGRHDFASRTVSWFVGDLSSGESREVSLDAIAVNIGEHHHKVAATAARGLKTESEIVTRVEGLSALLMELVDTDDPVEVGAETCYEIRVTNTGSKTETNLELVCTVPDKMEFRAAKCAAGCRYRVEGKDVIFEPLPRLAPRADVLYRVVVRGLAPGDMRFRARIRADGLSEPVLREESTKVYGDEAPAGKDH
jgi:uncharacterized repeat protein (TIGR01451 family)